MKGFNEFWTDSHGGLDTASPRGAAIAAWNCQQEIINRLVEHCSCLGIDLVEDETLGNDSWRSLPEDLQEVINKKTEEIMDDL